MFSKIPVIIRIFVLVFAIILKNLNKICIETNDRKYFIKKREELSAKQIAVNHKIEPKIAGYLRLYAFIATNC